MSVEKKHFILLALESFSAMALGVFLVAAFALMLSSYAEPYYKLNSSAKHHQQTASSAELSFPEDEFALEEMSDELAASANSLNDITPAAGE